MESVAHLVKLWFRELPESVFAPELEGIVDGLCHTPEQCTALCAKLPEANQKSIDWLLGLIVDVCRHESDNRMTAQGVSPRPAPSSPHPRAPRAYFRREFAPGTISNGRKPSAHEI